MTDQNNVVRQPCNEKDKECQALHAYLKLNGTVSGVFAIPPPLRPRRGRSNITQQSIRNTNWYIRFFHQQGNKRM